jgi:hypothetical protein
MKQAIALFLEREGFTITGSSFQVQNNKISGAVLEVTKPVVQKRHIKRETPKSKKWTRKYVGIYRLIREYLNGERKAGKKFVDFNELYKLVRLEYPGIEEERVSMYLYDKVQFAGFHYNKAVGKIML